MAVTYTYDPAKIGEYGKDRMRFELGDTMVEGAAETCALTDQEYQAIIERKTSWKRAKFALVESIMRRFSYEPDEKVGPLSLSLNQRYAAWKEMYDEMKKELSVSGAPIISKAAISRPPYFYEGMHDNSDGG